MTNYNQAFTTTKTAASTETSGRASASNVPSSDALSASITRAASKQTYYTIRLLADRDRMVDALRAYAYFRWVDDCLDKGLSLPSQRFAFVKRQQALINNPQDQPYADNLSPEEQMLMALLAKKGADHAGLHAYIQNMMAVMAFDAQRRGRLISQQELAAYTRYLAVAVTEALHYFIGHTEPSPQHESRYQAVTAAHITHMLRDSYEDVGAGYFNIPSEYLAQHGIAADDFHSSAYRAWVKERVALARTHFEVGQRYTAEVKNWRCRLAGFAYIARFQIVLDAIARDEYQLRPEYAERKSPRSAIRIIRAALHQTIG